MGRNIATSAFDKPRADPGVTAHLGGGMQKWWSVVIERVINLSSADAIALRDEGTVLLLFSDRLTTLHRDTVRDHLILSLDPSAPVAAVVIPAGQVEQMMIAPYANPAPSHPFPAPRSQPCIGAPVTPRAR